VDAFFSKFAEFQKPPRHPKWSESSIQATFPGWQRFKAAEDWLVAHNLTPPAARSAEADKTESDRFTTEGRAKDGSDPVKREAPLRQFLEWQKGHPSAGPSK
jgi:hypothetical protein